MTKGLRGFQKGDANPSRDVLIKEKIKMKLRGRIAWNKGKSMKGYPQSGFQKGHLAYNGTEETRFKKGQTPWNKGIIGKDSHSFGNQHGFKKGCHFDTEFKKGQLAKEKHHFWRDNSSQRFKIKARWNIWKKIKNRIVERDRGICQICGKKGTDVDHIIPFRVAQNNNDYNLQLLCRSCNSKKMTEDMRMW